MLVFHFPLHNALHVVDFPENKNYIWENSKELFWFGGRDGKLNIKYLKL